MINLLPIRRVIWLAVLAYLMLVGLVFGIISTFTSPTLHAGIKAALWGLTLLDGLLILIIHFAWKKIWSKFPILNTLIFPNLNGVWNMEISWFGEGQAKGTVNAEATIKQNFLQISMEVSSGRSNSETMLAYPKKDPESGNPILYYVYRVIPKQINSDSGMPYHGAAILKFSGPADTLRGNYFTSQKTMGHFLLTRITS